MAKCKALTGSAVKGLTYSKLSRPDDLPDTQLNMANHHTGCLQIQLNKFPADFQKTFKKLSVGFHVVTAWLIILRRQAMYELSLTEHVMMSSDQRSSLCHPTNLLALHESQICRQHFAIFHEDQLIFRRFLVLPGFPGAVDTLPYKAMLTNRIMKTAHVERFDKC